MGVPEHLFPPDQQSLIRVRPDTSINATNDTVYDYGVAAGRLVFPGWIQQDTRAAPTDNDGRAPQTQAMLLITNEPDIAEFDRIEWAEHPAGPITYELDGPPEFAYTPAGFHHVEAILRKIAG